MPSPPEAPELPPGLEWLADKDAFLKRYVLSLLLQPPPSRPRRRINPLRR